MTAEELAHSYVCVSGMDEARLAEVLGDVVRLADHEGRDLRPKVLPILARLRPDLARLFGVGEDVFRHAYEELWRARANGDASLIRAAMSHLRALQQIESERMALGLRTTLPLPPGAGDAAIAQARRVLGEE